MTVPLTGAGGLFTRLGALAKVRRKANTYAAGDLSTTVAAALAALGTEVAIAAPLAQALPGLKSNANSPGGLIQQAAQAILLKMVNDDATLSDRNDLGLALAELVGQMSAGGYYVNPCTVAATAAAGAGNSGNGVCVLTTKAGDGLIQQNLFAETALMTCQGDAQSQSAQTGSEPWDWRGDAANADVNSELWPGASGAFARLQTVDSQLSAQAQGNILTNSAFETFTVANTPDNWAIAVGSAGGTVFSEASVVYRGTKALRILGNGAELTQLTQLFNDPLGTTVQLAPEQSYAVNFWLRVSAAPAAGVLTCDLYDGAAVINDAAGTANTFAVNLTALGTPTIYAPFSGTFRTPRVMPATIKLRLRLSTALENGKSLYIDAAAAAAVTRLYNGGPGLNVFAGALPFIVNDTFIHTMTNDRAAATFGDTWQAEFDRWFGMRQRKLLLPYAGSTLIADTLITA